MMIDNIKFLGIPIFEYKQVKSYERMYLFGICFRKKEAEQYWVRDFFKNDQATQNGYIHFCGTPLGEASIFARTSLFWYKEGTSILCSRKQHVEVFKLFTKNIPVQYQGPGALMEPRRLKSFFIDPILGPKELVAINAQKKHFFKQWEKRLKVDFSDAIFPKATILEDDKKSALKKLEQRKIDLSNYVFILKNANSMKEVKRFFWLKLEKKLKKMGFDIVYNSKGFSISEAYVIATKAKAVISLRSGINDILSEIEVPQFLIYTKSKAHDDLQPMYSMEGFPWAAHEYITEYNLLKQKPRDVISDILKKIVNGL